MPTTPTESLMPDPATRPTASELRATDRAAWREAVLAAHVGAASVPDVAQRLGISVPQLAVWRRELKIRGPLRPRVAPAPTHRVVLSRDGAEETREIRAKSDQQAVNLAGRACDHEGYDDVTVTRLSDGATRSRRSWSTWPRAGWGPAAAPAIALPTWVDLDAVEEIARRSACAPDLSPRTDETARRMVAAYDDARADSEGLRDALTALDAAGLTPGEESAALRAFAAARFAGTDTPLPSVDAEG